MNTLTVVGTQWGDEGKGKVTDILAEKANVVVRFQGGNNAGHTICFKQKKYALHLIPSGIFRADCVNVLANGMVINPRALVEEMEILKASGITLKNLMISDRAHVTMPYHEALDQVYEAQRNKANKIGTTAKGIGPTYMDKVARKGMRVSDFINTEAFEKHLRSHLPQINIVLENNGHQAYTVEGLMETFKPIQVKLSHFVKNTGKWLYDALMENKKILFEGAQGTMLCLDHGTYPYVTSSSPTAASVALNTGLPPQAIQQVLGVAKAYTTRVGGGFFPTAFENPVAETIRTQGHEFGTTTGRPRRIGWLDTVVLRHAVRVNGLTHIAVMLLDVLQGIHPLKICVAYKLDGDVIDEIPSNIKDYERVEPIYIEMDGFDEAISHVTDLKKLPKNARAYLDKIETLTGVDIALVSIGPDREQTIIKTDIW